MNRVEKASDNKRPKDVNIKEAANGFVISQWSENVDKTEVAKDWNEAVKIAANLMGQTK